MSYDTSFQRRHGRWLIWLRIASLVPAIISLGLLSWALSLYGRVFTSELGPIGAALVMGPLGYCLVWSLSFVLAALIKSTASPMHPGFPVGFDFVGMGGLIGTAVPANMYFLNILDGECNDAINQQCDGERKLVPTERAANVFLFIDALFHAILFVAACRACEVLRRERKSRRQEDVELQSKAGSEM